MKCAEVRNLTLPYLDSELDARVSREVELHIHACGGCRRIYTAEEQFGLKLSTALKKMDHSPGLWEEIEAAVSNNHSKIPATSVSPVVRRFWISLHRWQAVAAALVLLAILGGGSAWWFQSRKPLDLALAMEHCHLAYASNLVDPEFTGIPDSLALVTTSGRLDPQAFAVRPGDPAFSVSGSRLCHITNVPVAFILAERRSVPLSMIVMKDAELANFPGVRKRFDAGHRIACSKVGDYEFAAKRVGDHVVGMIGDLPRADMEALLASIPSPR